ASRHLTDLAPPGNWKATKVPLFCTSRTPFSRSWIDKFCKECLDPPFEGLPDDAKLELIEGDFVGWTPLEIARRYVVPNLAREDSPFTSLTFAIADDQSHKDGKVLIPGIDEDYFRDGMEGYPLRIEATIRQEPEGVLIDAFLLHEGIHGMCNKDSEFYYDNTKDPEYVAEKQAWLEAGRDLDSPKPFIEGLPVRKYYLYTDGKEVSVCQDEVDDPTKEWWLDEPKSDKVREISEEEHLRRWKARVDAAKAEREAKIAEDVRRWIAGTYEYPANRPHINGTFWLLSNGQVFLGGPEYGPGYVMDAFPERVEVVRETTRKEMYERFLAEEADKVTQASTKDGDVQKDGNAI
ncbi:hypothetical protein PSEUBRA_001235, partial [Kalmanozyma brasiliensis GHG001]|uniref:uncharacterized protein n=1 Tax=Kalmanozyma brasiliensis (strain GHG001) TaxID=1365824 RepID=UPI0028681510